jgi:hypothetical protein
VLGRATVLSSTDGTARERVPGRLHSLALSVVTYGSRQIAVGLDAWLSGLPAGGGA